MSSPESHECAHPSKPCECLGIVAPLLSHVPLWPRSRCALRLQLLRLWDICCRVSRGKPRKTLDCISKTLSSCLQFVNLSGPTETLHAELSRGQQLGVPAFEGVGEGMSKG